MNLNQPLVSLSPLPITSTTAGSEMSTNCGSNTRTSSTEMSNGYSSNELFSDELEDFFRTNTGGKISSLDSMGLVNSLDTQISSVCKKSSDSKVLRHDIIKVEVGMSDCLSRGQDSESYIHLPDDLFDDDAMLFNISSECNTTSCHDFPHAPDCEMDRYEGNHVGTTMNKDDFLSRLHFPTTFGEDCSTAAESFLRNTKRKRKPGLSPVPLITIEEGSAEMGMVNSDELPQFKSGQSFAAGGALAIDADWMEQLSSPTFQGITDQFPCMPFHNLPEPDPIVVSTLRMPFQGFAGQVPLNASTTSALIPAHPVQATTFPPHATGPGRFDNANSYGQASGISTINAPHVSFESHRSIACGTLSSSSDEFQAAAMRLKQMMERSKSSRQAMREYGGIMRPKRGAHGV